MGGNNFQPQNFWLKWISLRKMRARSSENWFIITLTHCENCCCCWWTYKLEPFVMNTLEEWVAIKGNVRGLCLMTKHSRIVTFKKCDFCHWILLFWFYWREKTIWDNKLSILVTHLKIKWNEIENILWKYECFLKKPV